MLSKELTLKALRENLPVVMEFAEGVMEQSGCPVARQMQISLALEEIFINIASYAYAPGTGDACILAEVPEEGGSISFTFTDSGIPYDPLAKEDPDITIPAEKRDIGGLGIYLVKKYMDKVEYEYKDGRNILKVTKFF